MSAAIQLHSARECTTHIRTNERLRALNEQGFLTIYVLGLCMCMFFIGGISVDMWRGFTERRDLASIADAATVAAASQIDLDAFKARPSVLRLDATAARNRANAYVDSATAAEGIELSSREIDIVNGQVQIALSSKLDLTLTRLFSPGTDYTITVQSAAEPRVAT